MPDRPICGPVKFSGGPLDGHVHWHSPGPLSVGGTVPLPFTQPEKAVGNATYVVSDMRQVDGAPTETWLIWADVAQPEQD